MILTGWLAKKAVTKTIQIIILVVLVMASVWGIHYTGVTRERAKLQPVIEKITDDFQVFRFESEMNALKADGKYKLLQSGNLLIVAQEKIKSGNEIKNITDERDAFERDRLRDREVLHATGRRVNSLTRILDVLDKPDGQAELTARLEYFNTGIVGIAYRGNIAIQRTIQCKREIETINALFVSELEKRVNP